MAIPITALEVVGFCFLTPLGARNKGPVVMEVLRLVRPEERQVGVRVWVCACHRNPDLVGTVGTIARVYRSPERTAFHVRLEDGRWQLFWPEELEELEEEPGTG